MNREWLLICGGHNLLKLFRFGQMPAGNPCGFPFGQFYSYTGNIPDQRVA